MGTKKDPLDILKKPVHPKMTETTRIRELTDAGKTPRTISGRSLPLEETKLPKAAPPKRKSKTGLVRFEPLRGFNPVADAQKVRKTAVLKAKLRVLHESVPGPTGENTPPCEDCKTSACCSAFVVGLTKQEYQSGLYEPNAVEITPEMAKQLRGKLLSASVMGGPQLYGDSTYYYLEGRVGESCPFLGEDNSCTIYEVRPVVCRTYSCVTDPRITQEVRDGTAPLPHAAQARKTKND